MTGETDYPRTHGGVWRYLEVTPVPGLVEGAQPSSVHPEPSRGGSEGFTFWQELGNPEDWHTWPVSQVEPERCPLCDREIGTGNGCPACDLR